MKTKSLSTLLFCTAGVLLMCPSDCHGKTTLLRGKDDSSAESVEMQDAIKTLLERVASLEHRQDELVSTVSQLEQERNDMAERLKILEETKVTSSQEKNNSSQEQRRLQNSCIAQDSLEQGRFVLSGCDVYVQSGGGRTDAITGKGNLILGYNERDKSTTERTGSHNLIIGVAHQYKGHSGFVAGRSNSLNKDYASILGGHHNVVDTAIATIGGGHSNVGRGIASHVAGGSSNIAAGADSMILGGSGNTASATGTSIIGARNYNSVKQYSVVVGGGS